MFIDKEKQKEDIIQDRDVISRDWQPRESIENIIVIYQNNTILTSKLL